jgi:hypothetical protein
MTGKVLPQNLPCGCSAIVKGGTFKNGGVMLLHSGDRVCKTHGKRFRLVFIEIKLGDE